MDNLLLSDGLLDRTRSMIEDVQKELELEARAGISWNGLYWVRASAESRLALETTLEGLHAILVHGIDDVSGLALETAMEPLHELWAKATLRHNPTAEEQARILRMRKRLKERKG